MDTETPAAPIGPLKDQIADLIPDAIWGDNTAEKVAQQILDVILPPEYQTRAQAIMDQMDQAAAQLDEVQGLPGEARAVIALYLMTIKRLCYQLGAVEALWNEPVRIPREEWLAHHAEPILDVLGWVRHGISTGQPVTPKNPQREAARCDAIEEIVRLFVGKVRRRKVEEASLFLAGWLSRDVHVGPFRDQAASMTEDYRAFKTGQRPANPEAFGKAVASLVEGIEP